ncbi:MAG: hypothetical protein IPH37_14075 [Burkholderiales bacterium]|nr:hypothetical protein [Burkholderiales bacterium]
MVLVQSAQFDSYRRRVVIPWSVVALLRRTLTRVGTAEPSFTVDGIKWYCTLWIWCRWQRNTWVTMSAHLRNMGKNIIDAADEMLTRAWG